MFGDHDGLWRYDGNTFTRLSNKGALSIIEDKKGNIWTSSESANEKSWPPSPDITSTVPQIVNARRWVLSRYDGKSLSNKNPTETIMKSAGENNAFFGILEAFDGSIWVGSGDGVHRYDGNGWNDFKGKQ